jgi:hypothetical protein
MPNLNQPRSRAHHLGSLDRTTLITIYQSRKRRDAFETSGMDRDQPITAILDQDLTALRPQNR